MRIAQWLVRDGATDVALFDWRDRSAAQQMADKINARAGGTRALVLLHKGAPESKSGPERQSGPTAAAALHLAVNRAKCRWCGRRPEDHGYCPACERAR